MDRPIDCLVCRVAGRLCAIPLPHVREILRPLRIEPVAGGPDFVLGASLLRGSAVPVVDLARMLTGTPGEPNRLVSVQAGGRAVALAVDDVTGVSKFAPSMFDGVPPLLADRAEVVSALGAIDRELLLILEATRLVTETHSAMPPLEPGP